MESRRSAELTIVKVWELFTTQNNITAYYSASEMTYWLDKTKNKVFDSDPTKPGAKELSISLMPHTLSISLGNILLATYLGCHYVQKEEHSNGTSSEEHVELPDDVNCIYSPWFGVSKNPEWSNVQKVHTLDGVKEMNTTNVRKVPVQQLYFHSSYNQLMPVVKKLTRELVNIEGSKESVTLFKELTDVLLELDKMPIWEKAVDAAMYIHRRKSQLGIGKTIEYAATTQVLLKKSQI